MKDFVDITKDDTVSIKADNLSWKLKNEFCYILTVFNYNYCLITYKRKGLIFKQRINKEYIPLAQARIKGSLLMSENPKISRIKKYLKYKTIKRKRTIDYLNKSCKTKHLIEIKNQIFREMIKNQK